MSRIEILDSTLRDGMQSEGITFSVDDKLNIVRILDNLSVSYIEAGNPYSNPKESKFFSKVKDLSLKNSHLVSFGSTRRKNTIVSEDENLQALLKVPTEYVSIFGKAWKLHTEKILKTSLSENLSMIEDSCRLLVQSGKKVFFDAEHFFDGYKEDKQFATECIRSALMGGACLIVLCDTNGGTMPWEALEITNKIKKQFPNVQFGVHAHNDSDMAVALSVLLAKNGISHIQGTLTGFGERCGNANLSSVISNLQIKLNIKCIPDNKLKLLTRSCRQIADIANISLPKSMPYIGRSAFAHKAGMHIDGVIKFRKSFEHIQPEIIGNNRKILLSEFSGKTALLNKLDQISPELKNILLSKNKDMVDKILYKIKQLEDIGYQFENADASFELIVMKYIGKAFSFFDLIYYKIIADRSPRKSLIMSAIVKIKVGEEEKIVAAEGNGPINALDLALKEALSDFFPVLLNMHLIDYKVRVIDTRFGTASQVRVIISTSDGHHTWNTVGVSENVIDASFMALMDSVEYCLMKSNTQKTNTRDKNG